MTGTTIVTTGTTTVTTGIMTATVMTTTGTAIGAADDGFPGEWEPGQSEFGHEYGWTRICSGPAGGVAARWPFLPQGPTPAQSAFPPTAPGC